MLKLTLREYMGSQERAKQVLALLGAGSVTIGRSEACDYTIGGSLGEWAKGIARVQATLEVGETITLIDGSRDRASTNGIWLHGEPIKGSIALTPGLELTLFKSGSAKVNLVVSDTEVDPDRGFDTYTGEDLLSVLQEQVENLRVQGEQMTGQVGLLAEQLAARERIDQHQTESLLLVQKRLNRVLFVLFASVAAIVLASGWFGGSTKEREQLTSTLTSVAIAGCAAYFKLKEQELKGEKPKP